MLSGVGKPTRQRHVLILLLFLHTVNTYLDRVCISAAAGEIKADLRLTDQRIGYVFGAFAPGYALFQIPAGWLSDRLGPRKVLAGVVLGWSPFTALTGAAWNMASLLVVRFIFGVGEAGAFPGATRAFHTWLPVGERGLAQGLFHSGARAGAAVTLLTMPWLIGVLGWRWMFVVNGALGIGWALAWLWWIRDNSQEHRFVNAAELRHIQAGVKEEFVVPRRITFLQMVTSPNMFLAMFQYVASSVTFFISFTWLLPSPQTRWGREAVVRAPVALVFGMLAQWASGGLVTWLYGFRVGSRRGPAMSDFLLGALGLMLCASTASGSALAFVVCFGVAVFGVEMTISPSSALCMDIGGERSGAVSGSMNMLGNLGAALSAILFPFFVNHVTLPTLGAKPGTVASFFVFAAGLNLLAAAAWLGMNPRRTLDEAVSSAGQWMKAAGFGFCAAPSPPHDHPNRFRSGPTPRCHNDPAGRHPHHRPGSSGDRGRGFWPRQPGTGGRHEHSDTNPPLFNVAAPHYLNIPGVARGATRDGGSPVA
jgi:ACS family glucarate transporter-like MFS transporter